MDYKPLSKIYYENFSAHNQIYLERFKAPATKHFTFSIRQFNRHKEFPTFLCYTEELLLLLEKIYKKQEQLTQIILQIPPLILKQFELLSVIDEVKSTGDIEGVNSSRRELKKILEGVSKSPNFSSIIKKYNSLRFDDIFSFQNCTDIRTFYDDFIQPEITEKLDGKIFRVDSVDITSGTGKTLHRGVYPEEKIIHAMEVALQILNDENIPTLIRIAVFHYFFEYIHPFYDGNGRTARFIASYYLKEHFNYFVALRLSVIIKRNRKKYYEIFSQTDSEFNCGDLTPFVYGFTSMIAETFDDIEFNLKRKVNQLEKYREKLFALIPKDDLSREIYDILLQSSLFFGSGVSMQELMKLSGKSRNTINARLLAAPKEHITIIGKQKFFYKLNLKIFL